MRPLADLQQLTRVLVIKWHTAFRADCCEALDEKNEILKRAHHKKIVAAERKSIFFFI